MARPQTDINPEVVERLCRRMATLDDLACYFGCSTRTIIRASQQRPEIKRAMDKGYAEGRVSLRQAQIKVALSGNASMLIWLGKQVLGQSDNRHKAHPAPADTTLQEAMQELRSLSKQDVLAIRDIIDGNAHNSVTA